MSTPLFHWQAKEYHKEEKSKRWYLVVVGILSTIIIYALLTNNPVMAVTFILIGVVGYLLLEKDPHPIDFTITDDGLTAGKELYPYENIQSFWLFYEPEGKQYISLHTRATLIPYVKIPLGDLDPVSVRDTLLKYLHEEKHTPGLIDILEDLF